MNYSLLIIDALKPLWWIFPLLLLITLLKSAVVKGWVGEKLVEIKGNRRLPTITYKPLHNLTIPAEQGTTQIDHIYVSPFGIFVIETKNYKGWIFGRESDPYWTQNIFGKKKKFQNPLRQNYKHIRALAALLELPDDVFHSIIVFSGDCEFKTPFPPNICTFANFDRYIFSLQQRLLSSSQIERACSTLSTKRLRPGITTNQAHIRYIRKKKKSKISTQQ